MDDLSGKDVVLRPIKDADLPVLTSIKNDLRTQGWSQRLPPNFTEEKIKKRFEKTNDKDHSAAFVIENRLGEVVGTVNYHEDSPRLSAIFGIAVAAEYFGTPYTREAQELLLKFLFVERGVRVVRLYTQSGNKRAVNAAEKLGFRVAARTRRGCVLMERVADNLVMDMTREEYFEKREKEDPLELCNAVPDGT